MGKIINLDNIVCKDCKRKRCICHSDDLLRSMRSQLKDCEAKDALGDAIDLIGELKKIANKHGYFVKKEADAVN